MFLYYLKIQILVVSMHNMSLCERLSKNSFCKIIKTFFFILLQLSSKNVSYTSIYRILIYKTFFCT